MTDFIFECRKCSHNVYVDKHEVYKLFNRECPECGEEPQRLWILIGEGDFDEYIKSTVK